MLSDVPIDHWAGDYIGQYAVEGITSGCDTGRYCPDGFLTRAEIKVFLTSTFDLQLNG